MGASRIQEETAETTHFRIWQSERRVVARSGDADKASPRGFADTWAEPGS